MAGTERKRIIELTEASTVQSGDYIAVDSNARGTKKVSTDTLATSAALTAETNARTGADEQMSERMDGIEEQTALIQNPTKTLSGALCSFTDGADMPMVACTASIVPKQSGTGTPSPDNVRPISGWESVSVDVAGVNVWDEETELGGLIWANGQPTPANDRLRSKNFAPCAPNTSYHVFNGRAGSVSIAVFFYDASQSFINYTSNTDFTTPSNAHYFKLVIQNATTNNHDISINYPATDTEYHAYNPNSSTKTVNLGRTVYGGTLDIVTGVLTVTKGYRLFDNSVSCYNVTTNYGTGFNRALYSTLENEAKGSIETPILSDKFSYTNRSVLGLYAGNINSNSMLCLGVPDTITTTAEMQAWAGQNPFVIVYELAQPTNYQLTPTEVNTLLGDNNVWADSGDVEITYRRDISIVLENLENALSGSNSLNTMMMSAPTENTAEEPTEDEAEDDMR